MSTHEELLARIPAYALGALDGDELRELEAHLEQGCEECDRELLASTRQVESMAESVEPAAPSEMMRARLERELDKRESAGRSRAEPAARSTWRWQAAAAVLLTLAAWSLWDRSQLQQQVAQLDDERATAVASLAEVQEQLDRTQVVLARLARAGRIVSAPGARNIVLAGLESAAAAQGQTFVDPATRSAVFYASNLEPLDEDETYQLWFIADGTPVSAGIFEVENDGTATLLVDNTAALDDIQLWAVTIEPAGGVPQPTGQMVLKG